MGADDQLPGTGSPFTISGIAFGVSANQVTL